jgi:hypothetical protein
MANHESGRTTGLYDGRNDQVSLDEVERTSRTLFSGPHPQPVFDFRAYFCHSAPMETHAFGFRLRANAPEGQKRFSYQSVVLRECELPDHCHTLNRANAGI